MQIPFEIQKDKDKVTKYEDYPYLCYIRISTDKEEQETSPENQIDICRHWLEQNNFEWRENSVVFDDGISGTVLLDRVAMQLVLEKARKRQIKMVVFKSIHRLARDLRDSLEIKETLIAHGVRLVTIEEGYDSLYEGKNDMKFEMFAMFAAQYPKTLSVSISAALAAKLRRGEAIGPQPFGYKIVDKKPAIDEDEAPTVRQIFEWYVKDGYGMKTITHMLNEGVKNGTVSKPRKKDKWQITSVQRIIRNPTYAGYFVHNRYTKVKQNGRKKQIENPREKWVIYPNHHPAIVSPETWEKANNKEVTNKKTKITPWNEFRGLLVCSECGASMVVIQSGNKKPNKKGKDNRWLYLKCSNYRRAGEASCVNHAPISYYDFRKVIIKRLKRKGKTVQVSLKSDLEEMRKRELSNLEKEKAQLEAKNKDLVDLLLEKIITKIEFQEKRNQYESRLSEIENRMFLLSKQKDDMTDIKNIQDAFQELENTEQDLHYVFQTLINFVVVYPNGNVKIDYKFKG